MLLLPPPFCWGTWPRLLLSQPLGLIRGNREFGQGENSTNPADLSSGHCTLGLKRTDAHRDGTTLQPLQNQFSPKPYEFLGVWRTKE